MKSLLSKALLVVLATSGLMLAAADADARGHWRGRVGVYIGAPIVVSPWYRPYYGPAYPYYYPPYVVREEPTVYIEQSPSEAPAYAPAPAPAPQAQAPAQQQYWYFCEDSKTYYPHVQTCASPWQRVIPHAPPQP